MPGKSPTKPNPSIPTTIQDVRIKIDRLLSLIHI